MIVCATCGSTCPEGSRFCLSCGTSLIAQHHRAERKIVTALFCDLVGSTALTERVDPEDMDAFLRAYAALVREVVASFGGVVEKFIGDAAVAVFGVPLAHEDDSERAVRASLRLVERMAELPRVGGEEVQVRVGVNTGRAVIRLDVDPHSGEGFMVGDAINVAARLQASAPPMGVVVGETVHGLTTELFEYERLEPLALKGKSAPVEAWLAKAPLASTGIVFRRMGAELVGREAELRQLRECLEEAVATDSPRFVLLVGEAGIGKSRLIYELARVVDALPFLVTWRTGASLPFGETMPFGALSQIVRDHSGILETDDAEEMALKLDAILGESLDREWLRERLQPLVGLPASSAAPDENTAAWLRFIEDLAAQGPAVLVFEDLHWAHESLLAFLDACRERLSGGPLVIIGSARPELLERAPAFLPPDDRTRRLEVRGLTEPEASTLVGLLLREQGLPEPVRQAVLARCGGNPLYAEEYVRFLADHGAASGRGPDELVDERLPETLEALIAARLDTLQPERKTLLEDASVVGVDFWLGALAALGRQGRDAVRREVRQLARRDLVHASPTSLLQGDEQYSFWHALTRDVAYEQLPRSVRALKHADVAHWLEPAGRLLSETAGLLAHHYVAALELALASGMTDLVEQLREPTVRALSLAGARALPLDVNVGEKHFRHALRLASVDSPQRPGLLTQWANALMEAGRIGESIPIFVEGIRGLRQRGDIDGLVSALDRYSIALELSGDMTAAKTTHHEILDLLDAGTPSAELVAALAEWALLCTVTSDWDDVGSSTERSLAMAAQLELPTPVVALEARGMWRCSRGDERGLDDLSEALQAAKAQGLGRHPAAMYFNLAEELGRFRGPGAALQMMEEGLEFTARRHDVAMALSLSYGRVKHLFLLGRWGEALAAVSGLEGRLEDAGNLSELGYLLSVKARIAALSGPPEDGSRLAERLEDIAGGQGELFLKSCCLSSALQIRVGLGGGETDLARLVELKTSQSEPAFAWWSPQAVRDAVALGDQAAAEDLAEFPPRSALLDTCARLSCNASIQEAAGRLEEARESFAAAARGWAALKVPLERSLARLGEGRCLLSLGQKGRARSALDEAAGLLHSLGASRAEALAQSLLREAEEPA